MCDYDTGLRFCLLSSVNINSIIFYSFCYLITFGNSASPIVSIEGVTNIKSFGERDRNYLKFNLKSEKFLPKKLTHNIPYLPNSNIL